MRPSLSAAYAAMPLCATQRAFIGAACSVSSAPNAALCVPFVSTNAPRFCAYDEQGVVIRGGAA